MKILRYFLSTLLYIVVAVSFWILTILVSINYAFTSPEKAKKYIEESEIVKYISDPIQNQIIVALTDKYGSNLSTNYRVQLSQKIIDENLNNDLGNAIDELYKWDLNSDLILYVSLPENEEWPLENKPENVEIVKISESSVEQVAISKFIKTVSSTQTIAIVMAVILLILVMLIAPGNKFTSAIIFGVLGLLGVGATSVTLQGMKTMATNIAETYINDFESIIEKYVNTDYIPFNPLENATSVLSKTIEWVAKSSLSLQMMIMYFLIGWIILFLIARILWTFIKRKRKASSHKTDTSNLEKKKGSSEKVITPASVNIENVEGEAVKQIKPEMVIIEKDITNEGEDKTVTDSAKRDIITSGQIKIDKKEE